MISILLTYLAAFLLCLTVDCGQIERTRVMRFRETNHLRKLANESGKQMRTQSPNRRRVRIDDADPQCSVCHYRKSSHLNQDPDSWSKRNGMCDQFAEVKL